MRVGLFIPCYVDQLKPDVGMATVQLLEEQGSFLSHQSTDAG